MEKPIVISSSFELPNRCFGMLFVERLQTNWPSSATTESISKLYGEKSIGSEGSLRIVGSWAVLDAMRGLWHQNVQREYKFQLHLQIASTNSVSAPKSPSHNYVFFNPLPPSTLASPSPPSTLASPSPPSTLASPLPPSTLARWHLLLRNHHWKPSRPAKGYTHNVIIFDKWALR